MKNLIQYVMAILFGIAIVFVYNDYSKGDYTEIAHSAAMFVLGYACTTKGQKMKRSKQKQLLIIASALFAFGFFLSWGIVYLQIKDNGDWGYFAIASVLWPLAITVLGKALRWNLIRDSFNE